MGATPFFALKSRSASFVVGMSQIAGMSALIERRYSSVVNHLTSPITKSFIFSFNTAARRVHFPGTD